jgi:hypothetical protein
MLSMACHNGAYNPRVALQEDLCVCMCVCESRTILPMDSLF